MATDLELAEADTEGLAGTLTEEAHMALLHANALAAFVDAEQTGEVVFLSQVDGEEYEIVVRKKLREATGNLFG